MSNSIFIYLFFVPCFSLRFFTCFLSFDFLFSALASLTAFFRNFLLSGDSSRGRALSLKADDSSSWLSLSESSPESPSLLPVFEKFETMSINGINFLHRGWISLLFRIGGVAIDTYVLLHLLLFSRWFRHVIELVLIRLLNLL